jgi:hypothetical protein
MLTMALSRRIDSDTMSLPSHPNDGAAEMTRLWRDVHAVEAGSQTEQHPACSGAASCMLNTICACQGNNVTW